MYDQAILDVMNKELQYLDSKGWSAEFPVIFSLKTNSDYAIYEIQSLVSYERCVPIKFKLIKPTKKPLGLGNKDDDT